MAVKARVLDFTNVKDRSFNPKHLPAGDYRAKVTKVEDAKSKEQNDMWVFTVVPNAHKDAAFPVYCLLGEKYLWKFRQLATAAGLKIAKKKLNVDPNKVVGREIGITLEDDEYEGKMKSTIISMFPASDVHEDGVHAEATDEDEEVDEEVETDEDDEDLEEVDVDDV